MRLSGLCRRRNALMSDAISWSSIVFSVPWGSGTQSSSSPNNTSMPSPPRLAVRLCFQRSRERLRTMRPSQARKAEGRAGGMAFQVRRYVSLTHSSASL